MGEKDEGIRSQRIAKIRSTAKLIEGEIERDISDSTKIIEVNGGAKYRSTQRIQFVSRESAALTMDRLDS